MFKRILTAAIGIPALGAAIYFADTLAFPIVIGALALVGVFEMLGCVGMRRNITVSGCMYLLTVCTFVLSQFIGKTEFIPSTDTFWCIIVSVMFVILSVLFVRAVFSKGRTPIDKVCVAFITCSYIIAGFISMVLIKDVPEERDGRFLVVLCLLVPWVSDTFAYFGGRLFGKHKLIPAVSPKKTVEGSVCGIVFATLCSFGYGFWAGTFPVWVFAVLGFLTAIAAQIGDLIFSLIKRRYDVKDFGFIFPGHGGLLDRFDSVISTAPLLLILCILYKTLQTIGLFH